MNVQASTALHLLDTHPEQARPALEAIKHASSEALTELRGVLEALRYPESRAPAPTLARLEDLTAQAAAAGLEIETAIEGDAARAAGGRGAGRVPDLPGGGDERHPPRGRTQRSAALLSYGERGADRGGRRRRARENGSSGGGNGLPGMRERTAAVGGSLEAGPRPEGGFRVHARLPLPRADRVGESSDSDGPSSPLRS